MKCKRHQWAPLIAKHKNEEKVLSFLHVCLKCGQLKIGKKTIRISKYRIDMGSGDIKNAGKIYATELHGTVYYGHIFFKEKRCFICHRNFKIGDRISLIVVEKGKRGMGLVPCHLNCLK